MTTDRMFSTIKRFIDRDGHAPSYRDLRDATGLSSTSRVSHWLDKLEDEGRIRRTPGKSRTIRLVGE
jgi:repressor LexA